MRCIQGEDEEEEAYQLALYVDTNRPREPGRSAAPGEIASSWEVAAMARRITDLDLTFL